MFIYVNEAQEGIFFAQFDNKFIERNKMIIFNCFVYKTNGVHAIIKSKKKKIRQDKKQTDLFPSYFTPCNHVA